MKSLFIFLWFLPSAFAQNDSLTLHEPKKNAYPFWLLPTQKDNVVGIALGLVGSETFCDNKKVISSHGVNFQLIGQGLFIPFNNKAMSYKVIFHDSLAFYIDSEWKDKVRHNGILLSVFGTMTHVTNGIAINLLANKYALVNGISIGISNESYTTKGIQIGIINRAKKLKGFQFGLWNVNQKRKLPFINWCFKD